MSKAKLLKCERRSVLMGAAAAAIAPAFPRSAKANQKDHDEWPWDLNPLDALVRTRSRQDNVPVVWHYQGTFFGKLHNEKTVPLLYIEGASISRAAKQPDNTYNWELKEVGYFHDIDSHALLTTWKNPLNGAIVTPQHYKSSQRAALLYIGENGFSPIIDKPLPDLEFQGDLSGPDLLKDRVCFYEDLYLKMPEVARSNPVPGETNQKIRTQTSLATWEASLSDLTNLDLDFVPSTLHYSTLGSWKPWMEMGDEKGVISWRLVGVKHKSPYTLPKRLFARINQDHMGFFDEVS